MIELQCEQGFREWEEARLGIATASEASRIVTPTGKLSAARDGYVAELLAEWALGEPIVAFQSEWMERGRVLEPDALAYYSFVTDHTPRKVGLIYRDETRMFAASPDGLIGDDGGLELKCPSPDVHLLWLAHGVCPPKHVPQVQACLYTSGREWWDFMSYHPDLPPLLVRVERDESYLAALSKHIPEFTSELLEGRQRLLDLGVVPAMGESNA